MPTQFTNTTGSGGTISGSNVTYSNNFSGPIVAHDADSSLQTDPLQTYEIYDSGEYLQSFSQQVSSLRITITDLSAADWMQFTIDGVYYDLNELIADGRATFDPGATDYYIDSWGGLTGGSNPSASPHISAAVVTLHGPLTEAGFFRVLGEWNNLVHAQFEVGIDNSEGIPCFTAGTLIHTAKGDVAVEDLQVGDMVLTRDHGFQPIRWIGRRTFSAAQVAESSKLLPVVISAGALGRNRPCRDLKVSQQHRVLLCSAVVKTVFGISEVLTPAKKLLDQPRIALQAHPSDVTYLHLLFDKHEVVLSDGAWTESLFTGPMALQILGPEAVQEIMAIFPEVFRPQQEAKHARQLTTGKEGRQLLRRLARESADLQQNICLQDTAENLGTP